MKLDFGSGHNPRKGYKTCDITMSPYLDYVFDPDSYKVSCADNTFSEIILKNVVHHVQDLDKLFKELKRILTDDGKLVIVEPSQEFYEKNLNLDILWYRYIIPRYEIWISNVYRNYTRIATKYFAFQHAQDHEEKETTILRG
jgi:ubiquinone/menaquinone biosynthesis C-methylase UbiE